MEKKKLRKEKRKEEVEGGKMVATLQRVQKISQSITLKARGKNRVCPCNLYK